MVQISGQEPICCPSCGNRATLTSLYVCQMCHGIFCISGAQCGNGFPFGKCPQMNCGSFGEAFYEDTVAEWLTATPTAQSSLLSLDEWIHQQILRNIVEVRRSSTLVSALESSAKDLPFSVLPVKGLPLARDQQHDTWSIWKEFESKGMGQSISDSPLDTADRFPGPVELFEVSAAIGCNAEVLDQFKDYLCGRLSNIVSNRRVPTQSQVGHALQCAADLNPQIASSQERIASAAGAVDATLQWLNESAAWSNDVIDECGRVMSVIISARDDACGSFASRRAIIDHSRRLWSQVEWLLLGEIEYYSALKRREQAQAIEILLLNWLEQFENRILFEELRAFRIRPPTRATALEESWQSGAWGFNSHWNEHTLTGWNANAVAEWLRKCPVTTKNARSLSTCLGISDRVSTRDRVSRTDEHAPAQNKTPPAPDYDGRFEDAMLRYLGARPMQLRSTSSDHRANAVRGMLPVGCVWLRAIFDNEGRLNWWGYFNQPRDWLPLPSGSSEPGAQQRLEHANVVFDQATAAVWNFRFGEATSSLSEYGALTAGLRNRSDFYEKFSTADSRRRFRDYVTIQLTHLKASLPITAQCGFELLEWLLADAASFPFPHNAWDVWTAKPEQRRRIELDSASQQHLKALNSEWSLVELWRSLGHRWDWQKIDILFQVQGPLLTMPLAWLDFGSKPLFEQVASTSSAISLAMRQTAHNRAGANATIPHRLLSLHWIEPNEREHHRGLPLLHTTARQQATDAKWEIRTLGDEPIASVTNLSEALNESFGIVIIGAHGVGSVEGEYVATPGVQLANSESWCGERTNLGNVDTLILCCCAVGRLNQNGQSDVEGMYARLAAHGARCVVAARWQIADFEAALLLGEFLSNFFSMENTQKGMRPFDRARAFNIARKKLLSSADSLMTITHHLASAFEIYGLG